MIRLGIAFVAFVFFFANAVGARAADLGRITIRGTVRDATSGSAVERASIRLESADGTFDATTDSARDGTFTIVTNIATPFTIVATANGYRQASIRNDAPTTNIIVVRISLVRIRLRSIASMVVSASGNAPAESGAFADAAALAANGALRVSDTLAKLPGLTISGDGLAAGGDAYLGIRGSHPSEAQVLLDGHPIGPIGVAPLPPDADGAILGFNFQDAPAFALRSVSARYGTAAAPAFGVSGIGGTIDLLTLAPTNASETTIVQSTGTEGRATTSLSMTGRTGRIGYAGAFGVSGTSGLFSGTSVAQTGLRGTDLTSDTLHDLTYPVSGDYTERGALLKLDVDVSRAIGLSATAYDATSSADKTGEGDNDFIPYAYALANAPVGTRVSCLHGVVVTTDAGPSCVSPQTYASAASGPAGGGPNATQHLRNQDYALAASAKMGNIALTLDGFTDAYALLYHRAASDIAGPIDDALDRFSTDGLSLTATLAMRDDSARLTVGVLSQTLSGDGTTFGGTDSQAFVPAARVVRNMQFQDTYVPSSRFELSGRAEFSDTANSGRVDPAVTLTFHPDRNETIRFAAGRTTQDPSLQSGRVDLTPIGALNPDCGAIAAATVTSPAVVDVGTGPASNLRPESDTDIEIGYRRTFGSGNDASVTLYDTNVSDRIVSAATLAGNALPVGASAPLRARIASFCGDAPAPDTVQYTLSRPFNAATSVFRGIEFGGRTHLTRRLLLDGSYDLATAVIDGIPNAVLRTDPTLVNGAQAFEVPRTSASLGLTYARETTSLRLTGHAVGSNNPEQLPGFAYADASLTQTITKRIQVDIEAGNVFDSHAQRYGLVGLGVPYATNAFFADTSSPFTQANNERYGLQPLNLTARATLRF